MIAKCWIKIVLLGHRFVHLWPFILVHRHFVRIAKCAINYFSGNVVTFFVIFICIVKTVISIPLKAYTTYCTMANQSFVWAWFHVDDKSDAVAKFLICKKKIRRGCEEKGQKSYRHIPSSYSHEDMHTTKKSTAREKPNRNWCLPLPHLISQRKRR